ncbi:MAG: cytochrome c peroxidase [Pirellulales bacterium]
MLDRSNQGLSRACRLAILFALLVPTYPLGVEGAPASRTVPRIQVPIAAVTLDQGKRLAVAMSRSGRLMFVDVASGRIEQELVVAEQLTGLAGPTSAGLLLATDAVRSELIVLRREAGRWLVLGRQPVVEGAYSVAVDPTGQFAGIAGLWSHRWQLVSLKERQHRAKAVGDSQKQVETRTPGRSDPTSADSSIELPFAPNLQCWLPGGRVAVADAFGGHLAIIDATRPRIQSVAVLPLQNIGGLALSPDSSTLAFVHQTLEPRIPITRDAIVSGRLIRNEWSELSLETLSKSPETWNAARRVQRLDEFTGTFVNGAGDPGGIVRDESLRAVAVGGRNQLLIIEPSKGPVEQGRVRRIPVGTRPTIVAPLVDGKQLAVVNSLDDSISIVDLTKQTPPRVIRLSPEGPLSPAERGERVFFDASLSASGFLSCHSCHVRGHTTSGLADTSGDGTFGAPKRTPTLLGTGFTYRWGWNGLQASLHDQSLQSLRSTMHSDRATFQQASDMVAFLHTLAPPPPVAQEPRDALDRELLERGARVFETRRCGECHIPPLVYASHESFDVGLVDELGLKKFNPPSLRGASQLSRWLHDGRATSLNAVFRDHAHPNDATYTDEDLAALVRYLMSL